VEQRERVADFLIGTAFYETDGVCTEWHLCELRSLVAMIEERAAG